MTIYKYLHTMVRIHVLLVVAGLFIIAPNAVHAQTEWMNLSWGMSYQEVVERQPSARAMADKHNRQGMFYDVFARIDNVVVADVPFRADLLFDSEIRLTGVVMKAYGPSAALSPGYTRLLQELTDRHGRPTANRSIPNHPGNYSWNTDVSEIRLSYTEMVKGEADIVLAYYQTAIIVRQPAVVVRRDTVVVPPPALSTDAVPVVTTTPVSDTAREPDPVVAASKSVSFSEISVQASSDLKTDGFVSFGAGIGGYGYDPAMEWIRFYMNGFYNRGKYEESSPGNAFEDSYKTKVVITSVGARVGIGIPQTNVVLFGMLELFKAKYDFQSGSFSLSDSNDGYDNSFGGGIKVFADPSKSNVSFGIEYSELRRLGVSIGVTF